MRRSRAPSATGGRRATAVTTKKARFAASRIPRAIPTRVNMGNQFLPKQTRATLTYVEIVPMTVTAGAFTTYQFSCNGMYDPNISGTGHQPHGFDQMMVLYDHYTVLNSTFKLDLATPYQANPMPAMVVWIDDDTTVGAATLFSAAERPTAKWQMISPGTDKPPAMYLKWNAKDTFAGDALSDKTLSGDANTNPAEQSYYSIGVADTALTTQVYYLGVTIKYDVVFDELASLGNS